MAKIQKKNLINSSGDRVVLNKPNEKSSYHDNTIVFNAYNSEKNKTKLNSFWSFNKSWKLFTLILFFSLIVFSVYSYYKISNRTIQGSVLGKNYSELIAIPIIAIANIAFLSLLIKNSSKSFYTIWQKKFTFILYSFNIVLGFITPTLLLSFDILSNVKWTSLFLAFSLVEIIRIIVIYSLLIIKSFITRNLFPIELLKTKWTAFSLVNIIPLIFLYLYVFTLRTKNNANVETILLALTVVSFIIGVLITSISFIMSSKLDNQAGSFIEEEEKQSSTLISYILTIIIAPFIGIAISSMRSHSEFSISIIVGIVISVSMLITYSVYMLINFRKSEEEKRSPMANSIILDSFLFINVMLMSIINMFFTKQVNSWNYSLILIFGIYSFIILSINIILEVELFKYLFKSKLFIIYGSFILAVVNVIVISSLINSDLVLSLYNGELTTILFICQVLPMALILAIDLLLLLRWTNNTNKFNQKNKKNQKKISI